MMVPLSGRLVAILERRFVSVHEEARRPRYLDKNVLEVPAVALQALTLESRRLGHLAVSLLADALSGDGVNAQVARARKEDFDALLMEISAYVSRLYAQELSPDVAQGIQALVRASQRYLIVVEQAVEVAALLMGREAAAAPDFDPIIDAVRALASVGDPEAESFDIAQCEQAFGALDDRYKTASAALLDKVAGGELDASSAVSRRHVLAELRRGAKHVLRAAERLALAEGKAAVT